MLEASNFQGEIRWQRKKKLFKAVYQGSGTFSIT